MMSKKMFPLQMSTVLLVLAFFVSGTFEKRIIGGVEVGPNSISYQASLHFRGRHYCAGTLVHSQWVVSAAHCWKPSSMIRVVLGEHNLQQREGFEQYFGVSKIIVFFPYNYWTYNNDIMLIKLSRPAQLNHNVQPVTLPDRNTTKLTGHTTCTVSGWGVTQRYSYYLSSVLRAVTVEIIPSCGYYRKKLITRNMLCAGAQTGGKDSCQGDSGGPLVCNGYFEGIVSWGISCAHSFFPGVYTRVRNFVPWINRVINKYT